MKEIEINIGFYRFTLADYLLYIVYGFGICIYLYIIERIARQSKRLNTWRIINYIEIFAFVLFVFVIFSPFLLGLVYIIYAAFDRYTKLDELQKANLIGILSTALGIIFGVLSTLTTSKYFKAKNKTRQEEIEKEEIVELENAINLYENNFYSQAILEAFKVLEIHLIKLFGQRQINIPRNQFNFNDLFNYAKKLQLLDKDDIAKVYDIRKMRNSAAHLNIEHTKEQATKAIEFIKYLIQKTSDNNIVDNIRNAEEWVAKDIELKYNVETKLNQRLASKSGSVVFDILGSNINGYVIVEVKYWTYNKSLNELKNEIQKFIRKSEGFSNVHGFQKGYKLVFAIVFDKLTESSYNELQNFVKGLDVEMDFKLYDYQQLKNEYD